MLLEVLNVALQRVVMNLDEDLVKKVDSYAAKLHINRTAAASVLLSQACEQTEFLSRFPELMNAYQEQQREEGK